MLAVHEMKVLTLLERCYMSPIRFEFVEDENGDLLVSCNRVGDLADELIAAFASVLDGEVQDICRSTVN